MANSIDRKTGVAALSGAALAAATFGSPAMATTTESMSQDSKAPSASAERAANWEKVPGQARYIFKLKNEYKIKGEYGVAGVGEGRVIFVDDRGQTFYVDDVTGDQKFVTRWNYMKMPSNRSDTHHWIKLTNKVTILGVDEGGKVIMTDKKGDKFYLDAKTGDMIFVK